MFRPASKICSFIAACAPFVFPCMDLQAQEWVDPLQSITEAELRDHIHYLASDFLKGRAAEDEGYLLAAHYGAVQFEAAGLEPMFTDSAGAPSFFQQIAFENAKVSGASTMAVTVAEKSKAYRFTQDFLALQLMAGGDLKTEDRPVFLGYGIEEPDLGWNDYEGMDVTGKIAVIVGGAPTRNGEPVLPEEQHKTYGNLQRSGRERVLPALSHGVSALILVDDTGSASLWDDLARMMDRPSLQPMSADPPQEGGRGSPPWIILIRPQEATELLEGTDYDPLSGTGSPTPGPLDGIRVALDLKREVEPAFSAPNVVALLPGTDSILKNEYIVVTAHLDHVGVRDGEVYNGADDNASGSAAVLEAAEAAAMTPAKRSIIFVLLTAEEKGLLGAMHFADNPPVPIENIVLNINLDMVGRNSPDWPESLLAMGSENRRPELLELIRDVNSQVGANLDWRLNEGTDPHAHVQRSDQLAFMQKGIPAILITRGFMGPDYHRSSDDPETINYGKVTEAARLAFALAIEAGNRAVLFGGE
ncbi:MAG: M28 family peptidase [Gemmatimonadota bacterium]|nr:MAG: M28 family peptidase [Gemmatimonadota bacterium]